MMANMREFWADKLAMLGIVGASHKGYYEAYLAQMCDVKLIDFIPLLRGELD
jgi:predicted esterase YcpF (UPF0227 family)